MSQGVSVKGPAIGIALFAVVAIFSSLLLWTTLQNTISGDKVDYTVVFTDATGLHVGDDVRIAGVKVGRVEGIELVDNKAEVEIAVQTSQQVFENTFAVIRYQNLIGQRYLALRPGEGRAKPMADGGRIPADRTEPSLDLTALLGGFEPLFELLQPEDLNRLSNNIIGTLQGEGPALKDLLEQSAELTTHLASRDEVIGDVITNLTGVLDHLASKTGQFEHLIARTTAMVDGLDGNAEAILGSVQRIDATATAMTGLISDIRPALKRNIGKFNQVAELYLREGDAVEGTIRELPGFLAGLARASSYGSWANIYACAIDVDMAGLKGTVAGATGDKHTEVCR